MFKIYGILTNNDYPISNDSFFNKPLIRMSFNQFTFCLSYSQFNKNLHISQEHKIILLGRIYRKESFLELKEYEITNLAYVTDINKINEDYWGDFILIRQAKNNSVEIYKSLNCQALIFYYVNPKSKQIIFSSQISDLLSFSSDINFEYISMFLLYSDFASEYTPFKNIKGIPPGVVLKVFPNSDLLTEIIWEPKNYLKGTYDRVKKQEEIFTKLYKSVEVAISPFDNLVIDYSGGLDSTSVLYILCNLVNQNKKKLTAINYVHNSINSSNEIETARETCKYLGLELLIHNSNHSLPFNNLEDKFIPNTLSRLLMHIDEEQFLCNLLQLKNNNNSLYITGHGGDHLFCCPPIIESITDYFFKNGFINLGVQIKELAYFDRCSLFEILSSGFKCWLNKDIYRNFQKSTNSIFNIDSLKKLINPGLLLENKLSLNNYKPATNFYIKGLYHAIDYHLGDMRNSISNISVYHPLMSQPVVEAALSIPTFELYGKGYDRLFFREIIAKKFKEAGVWRVDKGETTGLIQLGIKHNLNQLKELISKGFLIEQNLINKQKVLRALDLIAIGYSQDITFIVNILVTEIFLEKLLKPA